MENALVVTASALLIGFIVWWFFGQHSSEAAEATMLSDRQEIEVVVSGGYAPNTVVLKQGVPARVVFNRKDASSCFNEVVFPDFGIREDLPVGKAYSIAIDTSKAGEYQYACGMNMFHGKVVIK